MAKLILVTVGTSALFEHSTWKNGSNGNWRKQEELTECLERELRDNRYSNEDSEYQHQKRQVLDSLKSNLQTYYENNEQGLDTLSAELASLLAMHNETSIGKITAQDKIVLLHSDTADGKLCAEVNKEVIQSDMVINGDVKKDAWNVDVPICIDGLDATNPIAFENRGLSNFQNKIEHCLINFNSEKFLNVTGGYKGLIPFGTLLAYKNEITLVYLFEKSKGMIILDKNYFQSRFGRPQVSNQQLAGRVFGRRSIES